MIFISKLDQIFQWMLETGHRTPKIGQIPKTEKKWIGKIFVRVLEREKG